MRETRGALQVGSLRGIPVRVHFSLLLVLPLLAYVFGGAFRRAAEVAAVPEEQLWGAPWGWGLGVAVGLFASVFVHELAHTLYALARGGQVRSITLMMVGGVSELSEAPPRARDEALMALVGPLTSLALAGLLALATWGVAGTGSFNLQFACFYLASLNLFLGVFNLLPAFPMDGGRILRALLAGRMGMVRATQVASVVGRGFALLFGVWGLATFNPFLMVIAFFIFMGADGEAKQVRMKATLEKVRVAELMTPRWMGVDVGASLEEALWEFRVERRTALPVTEEGRPLGRVAVEAVRAVPAGERTRRQVREVMRPAPVARLEEDGWQALRRMAEEGSPLLLVVDADGRLAGTLEVGDVERGLTLFQNREERAERDARRWREERPA
ncbi:Zn-dependent protease (includes SpoIVFB) [Myxococcus fulvus]|uniref:Zinc metalloprotease n=1 Tax=Myxococcus fulvus TaxID=33 RepID=A0A511STS8_MYXFU|nr:site-2 protease family protein [Myxococcus fulvus]GEN05336.1 metalloprotease [Myxococcus fulvus]SET10644.1 Zn-dependent protease (includes SpoIVFB) [Myxococcus fulvus]